MQSALKTERLNLRIHRQQKEVLTQAAQMQQMTVSEFILQTACEAAHEVLAEQAHFALSDEQWETFCQALDRPPKPLPALKQLLLAKGVFDG